MFDNFTKDKDIINEYIKKYNINENGVSFLRYEIFTQDNPKEFLEIFLNNISSESIIAITEPIVYDEDAYLNAAISQIENKHRRFYTINEILDFTKNYTRLNYFFSFKEEMKIENIYTDNDSKQEIINLLNDLPNNIKALLSFKEENSKLISFLQNIAVFILTKK